MQQQRHLVQSRHAHEGSWGSAPVRGMMQCPAFAAYKLHLLCHELRNR